MLRFWWMHTCAGLGFKKIKQILPVLSIGSQASSRKEEIPSKMRVKVILSRGWRRVGEYTELLIQVVFTTSRPKVTRGVSSWWELSKSPAVRN